jgi:PTS system mannose-specific IIA component
MFGGTPSNISLAFLKEEKVEVLTGVNLPMVIAIAQNRSDLTLKELAEKAEEAGKMSISMAGKLLE